MSSSAELSHTAAADAKFAFSWNREGFLETGIDLSRGEAIHKAVLTKGTSEDNSVGKVYHERLAVAPGDNILNLNALDQEGFAASSLIVNLNDMVAMIYANLGDTDLTIETSVGGSFVGPYNGSTTTTMKIPSNGVFGMTNPLGTGWPVGGSALVLINNPTGSDIDMDIAFIGTGT